jgi:MATE family multidrug resistance protein
VLIIAVPIMASNFSELLIGFVDTAILGQLGDAYYIGVIAVGSVIFSFTGA